MLNRPAYDCLNSLYYISIDERKVFGFEERELQVLNSLNYLARNDRRQVRGIKQPIIDWLNWGLTLFATSSKSYGPLKEIWNICALVDECVQRGNFSDGMSAQLAVVKITKEHVLLSFKEKRNKTVNSVLMLQNVQADMGCLNPYNSCSKYRFHLGQPGVPKLYNNRE